MYDILCMFLELPMSLQVGLILGTLFSVILFLKKRLTFFKAIGFYFASILLLMSSISLAKNLYKIGFYSTYNASIVHIDSHTCDGIYRFYLDEKEIRVWRNMEICEDFHAGDKVTVAYKNGDFLAYTIRTSNTF
jgi:hypothetical protein